MNADCAARALETMGIFQDQDPSPTHPHNPNGIAQPSPGLAQPWEYVSREHERQRRSAGREPECMQRLHNPFRVVDFIMNLTRACANPGLGCGIHSGFGCGRLAAVT